MHIQIGTSEAPGMYESAQRRHNAGTKWHIAGAMHTAVSVKDCPACT
jgi:hypothetical protein